MSNNIVSTWIKVILRHNDLSDPDFSHLMNSQNLQAIALYLPVPDGAFSSRSRLLLVEKLYSLVAGFKTSKFTRKTVMKIIT